MYSGKTALLTLMHDAFKDNPTKVQTAIPNGSFHKEEKIQSRAFKHHIEINHKIKKDCEEWVNKIPEDVKFLFIDEAQFLSARNVEQIQELSRKINVVCYGIVIDFQKKGFEGSDKLLEVCDETVKIPTSCRECFGSYAKFNVRLTADNKIILHGKQLQSEEIAKYKPICSNCYDYMPKVQACE